MASNRRERELARMRAERQAARRAEVLARRRARRNALLGTAAVVLLVVVAGFAYLQLRPSHPKSSLASASPSASPSATPSAAATPTASPLPPGTCAYRVSGTAAKKAPVPPRTGVLHTGTVPVVLTTNRGEVDLSLDAAAAPCTVNSFTSLAKAAYFNATSCHRLTTSGIFVLQCGDPTGTGSGGPGYEFADENLSGATYPAGTVAMANAGAGTNGSQFFLVYKNTSLPASYTPFGRITKGLDVLAKVAAGGSTPTGDGKPKLPVTLTTVRTG